jgi:hypothetical protein
MDPYLEYHNLWSEFHSSLAFEIRNALNPQIQPQYVARATAHVAYDDSGYATLINYHKPPPPPLLNKQETAWLEEHLRAVGKRTGERRGHD